MDVFLYKRDGSISKRPLLTIKTYDSMGHRATKKITVNGAVTLHRRYIYRGYLQITAYTYTPYGEVTATGDVEQPIQWSSEYNDAELALVYYNYRHYNPVDGRWMGRDPLNESTDKLLYGYVKENPLVYIDSLGTSRVELLSLITLLTSASAYLLSYAKQAYDYAGTNDKKQHCYMACLLSLDLGKNTAYFISILKEYTDLIRDKVRELIGDISEKQFENLVMNSMQDYYADIKCLHAQSKEDCKCCCKDA